MAHAGILRANNKPITAADRWLETLASEGTHSSRDDADPSGQVQRSQRAVQEPQHDPAECLDDHEPATDQGGQPPPSAPMAARRACAAFLTRT